MPPSNQFPNPNTAGPIGSSQEPQPQILQTDAESQNINATTKKPKNPNSTQNTLLLSEVRDNMVIMADGSFRAVVACKSINFDLMSSREREGVE